MSAVPPKADMVEVASGSIPAVVFLGPNTFQETYTAPNGFLVVARSPVQNANANKRVALGRQNLNSKKNDILAFSPSRQRNTLAACQRSRFGGHSLPVGHLDVAPFGRMAAATSFAFSS
jgi:hypothetical protein